MINNYNDLPLGTFLDIDAVLNADLEDIDKQVRIVAILADMTRDEVLRLPLDDYASMAAQTAFLREPCPQVTAPTRVIAGGWVLIPVKDFTAINTAQYVDFQTYVKDGTDALPQLLSTLLVPEGKEYGEGYSVEDVVAVIRGLPLPVAMALSGFFFGSLLQSISDTLTSLKGVKVPTRRRKAMEERVKEVEGLLRGLGLPAWTE